jgi:hypothetical protein
MSSVTLATRVPTAYRLESASAFLREIASAFSVWGCSSVGRALESHSRGQGFDSPQLHRVMCRDIGDITPCHARSSGARLNFQT